MHRGVLLTALVAGIGAAGVKLFPLDRSWTRDVREAAAVVAALALAAGVSLALGAFGLAREIATRRIGFDFARPVSSAAIWAGRLGRAAVLAAGGAALVGASDVSHPPRRPSRPKSDGSSAWPSRSPSSFFRSPTPRESSFGPDRPGSLADLVLLVVTAGIVALTSASSFTRWPLTAAEPRSHRAGRSLSRGGHRGGVRGARRGPDGHPGRPPRVLARLLARDARGSGALCRLRPLDRLDRTPGSRRGPGGPRAPRRLDESLGPGPREGRLRASLSVSGFDRPVGEARGRPLESRRLESCRFFRRRPRGCLAGRRLPRSDSLLDRSAGAGSKSLPAVAVLPPGSGRALRASPVNRHSALFVSPDVGGLRRRNPHRDRVGGRRCPRSRLGVRAFHWKASGFRGDAPADPPPHRVSDTGTSASLRRKSRRSRERSTMSAGSSPSTISPSRPGSADSCRTDGDVSRLARASKESRRVPPSAIDPRGRRTTLHEDPSGRRVAILSSGEDLGRNAVFLSDGRIASTEWNATGTRVRIFSSDGEEQKMIPIRVGPGWRIALGGEVSAGQLAVARPPGRIGLGGFRDLSRGHREPGQSRPVARAPVPRHRDGLADAGRSGSRRRRQRSDEALLRRRGSLRSSRSLDRREARLPGGAAVTLTSCHSEVPARRRTRLAQGGHVKRVYRPPRGGVLSRKTTS